MNRRRLRRRMLPILFAIVVAAISSLPIWTDWFSDRGASLLTLGIAAGGFVFKSALFSYMRHRMASESRRLTLFGEALVDYFTALVVLDLVMVLVFGTLFLLTYRMTNNLKPIPMWLTIANRSAINGGVALIAATGLAVAFEMRSVGARLDVHEDRPPWDGSTERRTPDDRRVGWGKTEGV
jgi:hypothetical protein